MGLAVSKDLIVYPKQDNIEWHKEDRQPNTIYGYNHDRKCRVVKIDMQMPEVPKGLIILKQDSKKPIEFEMHSFNRNYYNRVTGQMMAEYQLRLGNTGGAGYLNNRRTTGSWDTTTYYYPHDTANMETQTSYNWSSASSDIKGIVIGSGAGAFSFEDYALTTYTHGYSSNNLYYTANTPYVVSVNSESWTSNHSRFFDNFSGSSISNINEIGIYNNDANPIQCLEERTVLPATLTLQNKECLRVRYQRDYTIPSVNWTRNAYNIWMSIGMQMKMTSSSFGAGYRSVKDTSGNIRYGGGWRSIASSGAYGYADSANASNYGILVGTGNTAESLNDYALATKVSHSAAFTYEANSRLATTYTSGTKTYLIQYSRIVNNVSAGNTTIAEMGIVCYGEYSGGAIAYVLMARKVLASPVTLANGESLQAIYEISSVFPA
jgi:hypothetical protein